MTKKSRQGLESADILVALELHSVDQIRAALDAGLDPQAQVRCKSLVNWLTEMYSRGDEFPHCLRLLLDRGAVLDDPVLAPVLLNDPEAVASAVRANPSLLDHRTTMVSAFTPLVGVSLLHVAAEYGNADAARVLIDLGADVNAAAATDANGLNGHTPLFHTVNSNRNYAAPILKMLLKAGAKADVALQGITWGKGFEWETTLFDVTPISYAQFGLLPQVHRSESDIYDNIKLLLEAAGRTVPRERAQSISQTGMIPTPSKRPLTVSAAQRVHHLAAILAFVVGGTGCGAPTSPDPLPSVTLQAALSGSSGAPAGATSPPTVLGEQARVVVLGLMPTPDPCHFISASASKSGSQVTITLTARRIGGVCVTVIGEFAYRAVTPMSPGTYTVDVVHEYPGTGWPTEVVRKATVLVF
jgi:hypothetical protein